jgi:hypothetical protein
MVLVRREARPGERKQQYDDGRDRHHEGTSLHRDPPNETTISTVSGGSLPTVSHGLFAYSGHLAITDSGHFSPEGRCRGADQCRPAGPGGSGG